MHTLNLGILAHVDAGKTSLTERLLYEAGVITDVGSVDAGSTQTDTLALERQRGITIKSAVVSFRLDDPDGGEPVTVNLIDTPGHPDFIAEVERVLDVLDGAVLVISAVEGVQPQTRVLMRALRRLQIPTVIFVNKIDRRGARPDAVVEQIVHRLDLRPVPLGRVTDPGRREAAFVPDDLHDPAVVTRLAEVLAEHDDGLLAAYVDDDLAGGRVRAALRRQTAATLVHPVVFGSAITGAGVAAVRGTVARLLPSTTVDPDGEPVGRVFKIDRGPGGEKTAYVRMITGTLRTRDRLWVADRDEAKITSLQVFGDGTTHRVDEVGPGRIVLVGGLAPARIGDLISRHPDAGSSAHAFPPPTLETVVVPRDPTDTGRLHAALTELAEQDPLIDFRRVGAEQLSVSLYGEVQKEVIEVTLALDHQVEVEFRETSTICIERPVATGTATESNGSATNPYLAGIGLRVEPAPVGSGARYAVDGFMLGTLPPAFFTAIEDTVHEALTQGLHGWQVTDCVVTLIHSGYSPRQSHSHATFDKAMSSTAGDFRALTPLVLTAALRAAGTEVLEPVDRFSVDLPADGLSPVLALLGALGGVPDPPTPRGADWVLTGEVPAGGVHTLTQRLPGLTSGEGALEHEFARYRPVHGAPPERPRTGPDPRDRRTYHLQVR